MWKGFLKNQEHHNRPFMDFTVDLHAQELQYYTDSSYIAFAGYFDGRYFHQTWETGFIKRTSAEINLMELYAITVSIHLWAKYLKNHRVYIYSDNLASVQMVNNASSRCARCMQLIRHITLKSMETNTRFFLRHVEGAKNVLADLLSKCWNLIALYSIAGYKKNARQPVKTFPDTRIPG